MVKASTFIARKLRFGGKIAMVSIAISSFIVILSIAISSGFRNELRDGISALSGDIQLTWPDMNYVSESEPMLCDTPAIESVRSISGIAAIIPAVYRAGIVRNGDGISGVIFKGIPGGGDSLRVSIPSRLSDELGLGIGDSMLAYFVGERVKARKFTVAEIYDGVLSGNDNMIVFAGIEDMQRLNDWEENEVSAVEIILDRGLKSNDAIEWKKGEIGTSVLLNTPEDEQAPMAGSVISRFPQIFSWLALIDRNVLMLLILMITVAGFNMISGLLILLFRNISTIGILKSMGMGNRDISGVFLKVSSGIVVKGLVIGNLVALAFCLLQAHTHIIGLNPDNYFLAYVPVNVNILAVVAVDLLSYVIIMLLLQIPCIFVSRVDPARTVRAQ